MLTVENTGEKLTPQLVATLAEPFQRGTERIRTDHAGVGLGLAIVKSITQAHDGTLTLTPRAAGGLCVTVQLPAAPARLNGAGSLSASGDGEPSQFGDGDGVAQDEELDLEVGADVVVGDEGEHLAAGQPLDLGDELCCIASWKALRVSCTTVLRWSSIIVFSTSV